MDMTLIGSRAPRADLSRVVVRVLALVATLVLSVPYAAGWAVGVVASGAQWAGAAVLAGWRDARRVRA